MLRCARDTSQPQFSFSSRRALLQKIFSLSASGMFSSWISLIARGLSEVSGGASLPYSTCSGPSHYLKQLHLDTVTYNPPAVRMVLDWVGPDHVLYGSDAPPLTSLKPRAIKLVRDLDIPLADKDKIFAGNARRLLKLQ